MKIYEYSLIHKRLRLQEREISVEDILSLNVTSIFFNAHTYRPENYVPGELINLLSPNEMSVFFCFNKLNGKHISIIERKLKGK